MDDNHELDGRRALVTGGKKGTGQELLVPAEKRQLEGLGGDRNAVETAPP